MKKHLFYLIVVASLLVSSCQSPNASSLNLDGEWTVKLDPNNEGIAEGWYNQTFNDKLHLPGSLQQAGYGEKPGPTTKWWEPLDLENRDPALAKYAQDDDNFKLVQFLMPKTHYIGAAWYAREIEIPASFEGKNLSLILERCHWQTQVWIDGEKIGVGESLATAHKFDLEGVGVGKHLLSIRVDNGHVYDLGGMPHSVSDQTQGTWNGIVGELAIEARDGVALSNTQIYPNIATKEVEVIVKLKNYAKQQGDYQITLDACGYNNGNTDDPAPLTLEGVLTGESVEYVTARYTIGQGMQLWDEFDPSLYNLNITLSGSQGDETFADMSDETFAMRQITTDGDKFFVNGVETFMRGNVDCALNPATGHAPMDVERWKEIFRVYKDYGLNFVRFHSWCPPQQAFIAADQMGLYLAPEVHEWSGVKKEREHKYFVEESAKMMAEYGNHPSFVMMGLGNESFITEDIAVDIIERWKASDTRRLFTVKASSSSNPVERMQYEVLGHIKGDNFEGGRIRSRYQAFWPPLPENSDFNTMRPQTSIDWREALDFHHKMYNIPVMTHELAQFCAYPNIYVEMAKYQGYLRPTYLEIAAEQLEERGMSDQLSDFVYSSGMWQVQLTREEIEAAFRTPNLAGFQWLGLNDFTGQNTAPVGFVDAFYEPKPYVTGADMRRFCAPTVLLARLDKRTFTTEETLDVTFEMSNHAKQTIDMSDLRVEVKDDAGNIVAQKMLGGGKFGQGNCLDLGSYSLDLSSLNAPAKYNVEIISEQNKLANDYDFWLYGTAKAMDFPESVTVAQKWDSSVLAKLEAGETVVLLPEIGSLKGNLPTCFTTTYWTSFGREGGQSSACGITLDNTHPLFASFPTDNYASWQWWDILNFCQPMILDQFEERYAWDKAYRPLIQPIDGWKLNRKLALVVEAKVGAGKLLICSIDLTSDLDTRIVAKQLRNSLIQYVGSSAFEPQNVVAPASISSLFDQSEKGVEMNLQGLPTEG